MRTRRQRGRRVSAATASRANALATTRAITPPSCSTRTATTSKSSTTTHRGEDRQRPGVHRGLRARPGRDRRRNRGDEPRQPSRRVGVDPPSLPRRHRRLHHAEGLPAGLLRGPSPEPGGPDGSDPAAARASAFTQPSGVPAWTSIPSWYMVASQDHDRDGQVLACVDAVAPGAVTGLILRAEKARSEVRRDRGSSAARHCRANGPRRPA